MENANHNIDELFRQRLHDAEVPPPPFVWPAVEQALKKRRRRWGLWIFTFGTVAAATVWFWQSDVWQGGNLLSGQGPKADGQGVAISADPVSEQAAIQERTNVEKPALSTSSNPTQQEASAVSTQPKATETPKQVPTTKPATTAKNVPGVKPSPVDQAPIAYNFEAEQTVQTIDLQQKTTSFTGIEAAIGQNESEIDYLLLPAGEVGFVISGSASKLALPPKRTNPPPAGKKRSPSFATTSQSTQAHGWWTYMPGHPWPNAL